MTPEIAAQALRQNGIEPVGSFSSLPQIIVDAVETVNAFGKDFWLESTTAGRIVKKIVLESTI